MVRAQRARLQPGPNQRPSTDSQLAAGPCRALPTVCPRLGAPGLRATVSPAICSGRSRGERRRRGRRTDPRHRAPAMSGGDRVYDLVNRKGVLVDRVRSSPGGTSIVGFGPGVVYPRRPRGGRNAGGARADSIAGKTMMKRKLRVHDAATLLCAVALLGMARGRPDHPPLVGVSFRLSFQSQTPGRSPDDSGPEEVLSVVQLFGGQYADGRERLDVQGEGGRSLRPGNYLLIDSQSTKLVDPPRHRVSDTSLALDALATLDRLTAARVRVTGLTVRFDSLPANAPTAVGDTSGPAVVSIDGRPVRRYRVTLQWNMPAGGRTAAVWQQADYWVADFPINPINPYTIEHDAFVGGTFSAELRALRARLGVLRATAPSSSRSSARRGRQSGVCRLSKRSGLSISRAYARRRSAIRYYDSRAPRRDPARKPLDHVALGAGYSS